MEIFDSTEDNKIAKNNFELMFGKRSKLVGGMRYLLMRESIGGNAGFSDDDKYSMAGANFYFNNENGEIVEFSNIPRRDLSHGTFHIFVDLKRKYYFFFIKTVFYDTNINKRAKANIQKSINLYNAQVTKENGINPVF